MCNSNFLHIAFLLTLSKCCRFARTLRFGRMSNKRRPPPPHLSCCTYFVNMVCLYIGSETSDWGKCGRNAYPLLLPYLTFCCTMWMSYYVATLDLGSEPSGWDTYRTNEEPPRAGAIEYRGAGYYGIQQKHGYKQCQLWCQQSACGASPSSTVRQRDGNGAGARWARSTVTSFVDRIIVCFRVVSSTDVGMSYRWVVAVVHESARFGSVLQLRGVSRREASLPQLRLCRASCVVN